MRSSRSTVTVGRWVLRIFYCALLVAATAGCELSQTANTRIAVTVNADGKAQRLEIPAGSTVSQALKAAGVAPGELDRSDPPFYAVLRDGDSIRLTRVEEKFRTEIQTIPFQRQILRNESLPEGQERLVQAGVSGRQELTFRDLFENGEQTSESIVKTVVLSTPAPEIVMIGAQSSFAPVPIPGMLAYLAGGNAWIMDTSTANRRLLVNSGDLDGKVFQLSSDHQHLLYTRRSDKPSDQEINTLWAIRTDGQAKPISLHAANIVHFAGWYPSPTTAIAYSSVEPRPTAPGWQANNDLIRASLDGQARRIMDARSGGVYGWWGMSFEFSLNGRLAYSRPDGIGLVSQDGGYLAPLIDIAPLQTHSDWAWTPGISWGPDSETIFFVDHAPAPPPVGDEESPFFDLKAISLSTNVTVDLVPNVGMFASPAASPVHQSGVERAYQVAFLQAIFPDQSETSRYRLSVMDRDGSNRRPLFPSADLPGLEPQTPVWSPAPIEGQTGDFLAVLYQGNLWLVDSGSGEARQITGDGLVSEIDWR